MKFHITAAGDRTVGDGDHYALVDIPYLNESDVVYVESTKESLREAFVTIFDNRNVFVQTDLERNATEGEEG
jgi:hypothetical protein